jgi:hypothetical protein
MMSMDAIRARIRRALDEKPDKSQKGLAAALGISPAQVTSPLKPDGRELMIDEIPVIEGYLEISLLHRSPLPLSDRERDTVLAALRLWQSIGPHSGAKFHELANRHGAALTPKEIEKLIRRLEL